MKSILILFIVASISTNLFSQEYVVVSRQKFDNVSVSKIRALFLKKSSYIKDQKIIPLNLSSRNKIRKSFEKRVLHMSFARLKSYWTKQHYLGHRPPISMKSEKGIKAFMKNVDGAIAYMELDQVNDNLKIIYRWSE